MPIISPVLLWFVLGTALLIIELFVPGIVLVFFGIGAWLVALATYFQVTSSIESQLLLFAISSTVLLVGLRRFIKAQLSGYVSNVQDPSRNLDEFIGREVTVLHHVAPGKHDGQVEFKGTVWGAVSDEHIKKDETAFIESVDGIVLKIKKQKV